MMEVLNVMEYLKRSLYPLLHPDNTNLAKAVLLVCVILQTISLTDGVELDPSHYTFGNLTCHQCYYSVDDQMCLYLQEDEYIRTEYCYSHESYCMAERIVINGDLLAYERRCAEECEPGCFKEGLSYWREKCRKCCKENMCNFGSERGSGLMLTHNLRSIVSFPVILIWIR